MATEQTSTTVPVEDQDKPAVRSDASTPLDFSELTPHQFGISMESFVPSSSNCKDKSRLAQIKARRRSSVGVRGSPETNSLIRFRAQQRMKTPPASHTPELVRSSPFFPRVASTLRQKMASFQSLMDVAEIDACDPTPVQDSSTGGCISTRDNLSDGISSSEEKENNPPTASTPSKKRRLGPLEGCSVEIRKGNISAPHSSLKEHETPWVSTDDILTRDATREHQSSSPPPPDDPSAVSPAQQSHLIHILALSSVLEMKPTDVDKTPVVKKKQVRFGGSLSPEFFDKNLPPSTPLQKGGTPARAATPGGGLQLRSLLKTPQRSEPDAQQSPLEPLSLTGFGASPTFAMPRKHRGPREGGDCEDGKIVFPSMEEIDSAVSSDAECVFDAQPLNLNMAFHEESLSQDLEESNTEPNKPSQVEDCEHTAEDKQPEDGAKSRTPTQSRSKRRRKEPEDSEPVKRSTRSAAKSACVKMKVASSAARRWNKEVDRSLYGSRAYASKNPTLSPITERRSFGGQSAVVQQASEGSTARANRQMRSTVRRGQRKRKGGVADCEVLQEETAEQHFEGHSSVSLEVSQGSPSALSETEPCEADPNKPSVPNPDDVLHTDSSKSECDAMLPAPTPGRAPAQEDSDNTEPAKKQARQDRSGSTLPEPQHADEKEAGAGEPTRDESESARNCDRPEEGEAPSVDLAPWQADFNFEDVFKPVATKGQRSVRRSLRNQANCEIIALSAGLAWLPHNSPDSVKETRRKSRQRRLSARPPVAD